MRHKHKQPIVKWRYKGVGILKTKGVMNRRIIGVITEPYTVDGIDRKREFTFHATKGFRSNRVA